MPSSRSNRSNRSSKSNSTIRANNESIISLYDNRRNTADTFNKPSDCWPTDEQKFLSRNCTAGQRYHDLNGNCCDIDGYIQDKTHDKYRKSAISDKFYKVLNSEGNDLSSMWELNPLQHKFGTIDILKQNMTNSEKESLSLFIISKRLTDNVKKDLKTERDKRKKKVNRQINMNKNERTAVINKIVEETKMPINFTDWPERFTFVTDEDSSVTKRNKKKALRDCLNRRITFMRDCVYDCGRVSETWIKLHMDFILKLQILAIQLHA